MTENSMTKYLPSALTIVTAVAIIGVDWGMSAARSSAQDFRITRAEDALTKMQDKITIIDKTTAIIDERQQKQQKLLEDILHKLEKQGER